MTSVSYLQYKLKASYEEAKRIQDQSEPVEPKVLHRVTMPRIAPEVCLVKKIKQRS
jgi:hypothetical protein